jgi:hypothetical protein
MHCKGTSVVVVTDLLEISKVKGESFYSLLRSASSVGAGDVVVISKLNGCDLSINGRECLPKRLHGC